MNAGSTLSRLEDDGIKVKKDGTVEVRDGQVIIKNPQGAGKQARTIPGRGVRLFVNDIEAKTWTSVYEGCRIKIDMLNKAPERVIETIIEDGGMTAYAKVYYKPGERYVLKDTSPANEIHIDGVKVENIECMPYTLEEALAVLKGKGIVWGILQDNLSSAIADGTGRLTVIAKGSEPVNGTDDIIIEKYEKATDKKYVEVEDRVDFYSIGRISSVNPGELVAEKITGNDGKPGMDIFGKEVKQKSGKRVKMLAGRGTRVSDDGLYVYSEKVGRPEINKNVISVYEVYEVQFDVNVSTGNIEFAGDIIVKGNVTDGMKVKSGGNITIMGGITGADISAGGNIRINQNIIGSQVKAGCADTVKLNIIEYFEGFKKGFMEILSAVEALKETGKVPKTYKDGQIIKLLTDTKFRNICQNVLKFRDLLSSNRNLLDDGTIRLGAKIIRYFTGNGPLLIDNCMNLKVLSESLSSEISSLEGQLQQPSHIYANYVQNSSLTTSGNIVILGKGCYNSNLNCRGDVTFERPGSVMRGGLINAGGNVKIYELGSPGGAITSVSAGKDCTITCETAHMSSVLKVGSMSSSLEESSKKLKAYLYKGEIMIEKSKL